MYRDMYMRLALLDALEKWEAIVNEEGATQTWALHKRWWMLEGCG
jgi:hypothetical protein